MKLSSALILIFCGAGIAQSIFFAINLVTYREGNRTSNRLLATLLIALAIRLAKSLTFYFFSLSTWFMNLGYAAHLALAPLLLMYLLSLGRRWSRAHLIHLLPSLGTLCLALTLTEHFWMQDGGYAWLLYYSLVYLAGAWVIFFFDPSASGRQAPVKRWLYGLLLTVTVLCLAYFANYILRLAPYVAGPVAYSFMIYGLSYLGFRYYENIFGFRLPLRKTPGIPGEQIKPIFERFRSLVVSEKLFLNPELTVAMVSARLDLPAYRLSRIVNEFHPAGFTDLINGYRVEEARKLLLKPGSSTKVAAVAMESGFNTLSAFNAAFKRVTGETPSSFRKSMVNH